METSSSFPKSLAGKKAQRAELLRLKAGFIDSIPSRCTSCKKNIELNTVERQLENFDIEQLKQMQKCPEKIGLFCCRCLVAESHLPLTRRVPPVGVWSGRDVRVSVGGRVLDNIISMDTRTYIEYFPTFDPDAFRQPQIGREIILETIAIPQSGDLCGRELNVIINNTDMGNYRINNVEIRATPNDVIRCMITATREDL